MVGSLDDVPLKISTVFEDEWLLIVNKPAGLAVHVNPGDAATSTRAARRNLQTELETRLSRKLTLFHRLDKDTTGLIILGKSPSVHRFMTEAFEKKSIRKTYMAVVQGAWLAEWNRVENFLDRDPGELGWINRTEPPGKRALTTFRLLKATAEKSWLEALPKTGRTHQIRLHCLAKNCPILGDPLYNPSSRVARSPPLALHAYRLDFVHPVSKKPLRLFAEPPSYWLEFWLKGLDDGSRLQRLLGAASEKPRQD